jgi:D-tyrosyl-tRNA(Tyr) deacylase
MCLAIDSRHHTGFIESTMRAVVQRVKNATVTVAGEVVGAIDAGLLIYLAVGQQDTDETLDWMVRKVSQLRIFEDAAGKMNGSLLDDPGLGALVVSQFTLYGDMRKGSRPSFNDAAEPEKARNDYQQFIEALSVALKRPVACGRFAADMQVASVNDGPVTILLSRD